MTYAIKVLAYDPTLDAYGTGCCCNSDDQWGADSKVLAVSIYTEGFCKVIYPDTQDWEFLQHILLDKECEKVFHDAIYDLGWLFCRYGMNIEGTVHDTMTRMAYINEYADLNIDRCLEYFGRAGNLSIDQRLEMLKVQTVDIARWKADEVYRRTLENYVVNGSRKIYDLFNAQETAMKAVDTPYKIDCNLIKLVLQMKKMGVRIDGGRLAKLTGEVEEKYFEVCDRLEEYGLNAQVIRSPKLLGYALNKLGIYSPVRTNKGAESWNQKALIRLMNYPVVRDILEFKNYDAVLNKFLYGSMRNSILGDGRIHCTFTPNKRESHGTITGRFSSFQPNLQQIPARDKECGISYGQAMRQLFLPEEGCYMAALDYSQIEYILLAHYAQGPQSAWFRQQACKGVDFHNAAMEVTGIPTRDLVKPFNYGSIYGMGVDTALEQNYVIFQKAAEKEGRTVEEFASAVYKKYHQGLPVIKDTMRAVMNDARYWGSIKSVGGRILHLPPEVYNSKTNRRERPLYKMLNTKLQGSAADIIKLAMSNAFAEGLFDVLPLHLQVHDELVCSVPKTKEGTQALERLHELMCTAYRECLTVPLCVQVCVGPDWGYWKDDIYWRLRDGEEEGM